MRWFGLCALVCAMGCGASPEQAGGAGGLGGTGGAGIGANGGVGGVGGFGGVGGTGGFAAFGGIGGAGGFCTGLQCQQMECPTGTTTISGKVYDPAGKNPLYNVAVYVPNEPLQPLPSGASCNPCHWLYTGHPIASTLTDATGSFVLPNAPVGQNIPLVVQIGKWRREFVIPTVTACTDNPQPDRTFTLPKNTREGELPNIAIATGGADTLECLLRRIGVDASEYVPDSSTAGRVHIFGGGDDGALNTNPPALLAAEGLWNSTRSLMAYDIVLLSCEGEETNNMNQQALHDYANAGGRVFASHYHYAWFNTGPYGNENLAEWLPGGNTIEGYVNGEIVQTLNNGMPFPKGAALFQWLGHVGALTNTRLPIQDARHNANVRPEHMASQPWIVSDATSPAPGATQYFSFNTPTTLGGSPDDADYCGRVVFSALHVGAASGDLNENSVVPLNCANADLSAQEKVLEFMLFDLSACVTPDEAPPMPPPLE